MALHSQQVAFIRRETIQQVDWSIPQWEREKPRQFWDPSRKLIKSIRDYQKLNTGKNPISKVLKKICIFRYRFWSVVTGAEIDLNVQIGGGLLIPHPNGIVIHPKTRIGPNCLIFQQVTLADGPVLGHHVDIGAGAKIVGKLQLGNNAKIGANAVVTKDVRQGATMVGVPAKEIRRQPPGSSELRLMH